MTDPTGRCFISYRRKSIGEISRLVAALHDVGIPTWQDVDDLGDEHVEEDIRRTLADPSTAGAIVWITSEVADSAVIRRVEIPAIMRRLDRDDGFFAVFVAAGGLNWAGAAAAVGPAAGVHGLDERNIRIAPESPLTERSAAEVASWVLRRRLETLDRSLPPGAPLRLGLYTRARPPSGAGLALALDWQPRIPRRRASAATWRGLLLPALDQVGHAIRCWGGGRGIEAEGLCSLPAAVALGCEFVTPGRTRVAWRQVTEGWPDESWSLDAPREESSLTARTRPNQAAGRDFAVLVSVDAPVAKAFASIRERLSLRATIEVHDPARVRVDLGTPGLAADVARKVQQELLDARSVYGEPRRVHLFLAVPAGLAMIIGQLLNTFGEVQTYEFLRIGRGAAYRPAALIRPSDG